jgi:hypothetical protein
MLRLMLVGPIIAAENRWGIRDSIAMTRGHVIDILLAITLLIVFIAIVLLTTYVTLWMVSNFIRLELKGYFFTPDLEQNIQMLKTISFGPFTKPLLFLYQLVCQAIVLFLCCYLGLIPYAAVAYVYQHLKKESPPLTSMLVLLNQSGS